MQVENYAKQCIQCKRVKVLEEFYVHAGFPDKKRNKCVRCCKNDYLIKNGKEPVYEPEQEYEVNKLPELVKCEVYVPKEELTTFLTQMRKLEKKYVKPI